MKEITITVEGGVIQNIDGPSGTTILVKDYDIDGTEEEKLRQDEEGNDYIESVWKL